MTTMITMKCGDVFSACLATIAAIKEARDRRVNERIQIELDSWTNRKIFKYNRASILRIKQRQFARQALYDIGLEQEIACTKLARACRYLLACNREIMAVSIADFSQFALRLESAHGGAGPKEPYEGDWP